MTLLARLTVRRIRIIARALLGFFLFGLSPCDRLIRLPPLLAPHGMLAIRPTGCRAAAVRLQACTSALHFCAAGLQGAARQVRGGSRSRGGPGAVTCRQGACLY